MDTNPVRTLDDLARKRDAILARIVDIAERDERVVAMWLTGSFGRGEDDAWSDFDLHLAIDDDHLEAWWQAREEVYREVAPPLLIQREKSSNAQEGGHFQLVWFPGPVEVDWNVGPVSLATRPPTSTMLLARADIPVATAPPIAAAERDDRLQQTVDFFWAMAPIAIKYAGRGATTDAVDQIDLLIGALTNAWWLLHDSPNLSNRNPAREPDLMALLPRMGPAIDPAACLDAIATLMDAMTGLRASVEALDVAWPSDLIDEIGAMIGLARRETG